jgi:hypothetical protein
LEEAGGARATASVDLWGPVVDFLRRCGELAASQPLLFLGLLIAFLLPSVALSTLLLRSFFAGRQSHV